MTRTCDTTNCRRKPTRSGYCTDHAPTPPPALGLPPGVTYRQVDHWVRQGYLRPGNPRSGSGTARIWDQTELHVIAHMARLVDAGLIPAAAARIARDFTHTGRTAATLRGNIMIALNQQADSATA